MTYLNRLNAVLEAESKPALNPYFWTQNSQLEPEIRNRLIQIAYDFIDDHELSRSIIKDIIITGSIANYNWTKQSDIDLHLIIDPADVDEDVELVREYLKAIKSIWNMDHKIEICGHEVEVYLQDLNEPHHSTGVYSAINNRWLLKPDPFKIKKQDDSDVKQKTANINQRINDISKMIEQDNLDLAIDAAERLKDKIKKMRQAGLEAKGELSTENLIFKKLRHEGQLERLSDLSKQAYDKKMSLSCS